MSVVYVRKVRYPPRNPKRPLRFRVERVVKVVEVRNSVKVDMCSQKWVFLLSMKDCVFPL